MAHRQKSDLRHIGSLASVPPDHQKYLPTRSNETCRSQRFGGRANSAWQGGKLPAMFNDSRDLARAALKLSDMAGQSDLDVEAMTALELGAAMLCAHVRDWHDHGGWSPIGHEAFKAAFPEWGPLCHIANGTKHAKPQISDPASTEIRELLWEDSDFWWASQGRPNLFVMVHGEQRAVSALIASFANHYIEVALPPATTSVETAAPPG